MSIVASPDEIAEGYKRECEYLKTMLQIEQQANASLREEAAWIRKKLGLPEDCGFVSGRPTLAGTMHVVCSHAHGYEKYITAYKCDDKQGEIARLTVEVERMRDALTKIAKWFGEFPETGRFWEGSGNPMSYGAVNGSNGERDFMRQVASEALTPAANVVAIV